MKNVLIVFAVLLLCTTAMAQEMILNGGFEADGAVWPDNAGVTTPQDWNTCGGAHLNDTACVGSTPAYELNAMAGWSIGWGAGQTYLWQTVSVTSGTPYDFSFAGQLGCDGTDEVLEAYWYDSAVDPGAGGCTLPAGGTLLQSVPTGDWVLYEDISITPTSDTGTIVFRFWHVWATNIYGGHVDSVSLTDATPVEDWSLFMD